MRGHRSDWGPARLRLRRRGVNMGPSAIRYAGLRAALEALGHTVVDRGSVRVPLLETCGVADPKLRYLDGIVARVPDCVTFCGGCRMFATVPTPGGAI